MGILVDPTWFTFQNTFNLVAGVSSIVGLGVTVKVAWDVRRIRKDCQRRGRLPALGKQIDKAREQLNDLLVDEHGNDQAIKECLARLRGDLSSVRPIVFGEVLELVQDLDRLVDRHLRGGPPVNSSWLHKLGRRQIPVENEEVRGVSAIQIDLSRLGRMLENQSEDDKWRGA